ncbi:MAG: hypothetical protein QM723_19210 [Myxococcaceae bacterium]
MKPEPAIALPPGPVAARPELALEQLDHEVQQAFGSLLALAAFEPAGEGVPPPARMPQQWQISVKLALIESTALHSRAIALFLEREAGGGPLLPAANHAFVERLVGPVPYEQPERGADGVTWTWDLRAIEPLMAAAERYYAAIGRRFPEPRWEERLARFGELMAGAHTTAQRGFARL